MTDRGAADRRQDQDRRTAAARRGVRVAGVVGAAGVALALGTATAVAHVTDREDTGSTGRDSGWVPSEHRAGSVQERGERSDRGDDRGEGRGDDGTAAGTRAPRPARTTSPSSSTGGLASPGGSGPSHSSSSGS